MRIFYLKDHNKAQSEFILKSFLLTKSKIVFSYSLQFFSLKKLALIFKNFFLISDMTNKDKINVFMNM